MTSISEHSIQDLQQQFETAFDAAVTLADLESVKQQFIGKKSLLGDMLKGLKLLEAEDKKVLGPKLNEFKTLVNTSLELKQKALETEALNSKLAADWIDMTDVPESYEGSLHPMTHVLHQVEDFFTGMGFEVVDGPEVETEWFNFDALNVPGNHPARDMQDTFWVKKESEDPNENYVLRTQTSNMQIRKMLERGAPLKMIAPGRVFRNEDVDSTHDAVFYQVEGLMVDKGIHLGYLKGVLQLMLNEIFGREVKLRIRPGYFPFVEPGLEVDIWFEYTDKNGEKQAKWLEFMGAGMVHPEVLKAGGVDPDEYQGFAFGFGLTRLVMMRYGIEDIRHLFSLKLDFLKQF